MLVTGLAEQAPRPKRIDTLTLPLASFGDPLIAGVRKNVDAHSILENKNVANMTIVILIFVLFIQIGEAVAQESISPNTHAVSLNWYNNVATISTLTYRLQAISSTTCQNSGKTQTTITEIDQVFSLSIHPNVSSGTFNLFFRVLEEIIKVNGTKVNLPY